MKGRKLLEYLLALAVSITLALLVGGVIMSLFGYDPIKGYQLMIDGAISKPIYIGDTLAKSATLCLTGLATAIAAQAGIFNVGGEGQLYLGAMASAVLGAKLAGAHPVIAIPLCLLAGMAAGGLYAWIPGILKVKLKVDEVVTTILLNSAAIYFCSYLASGPLKTAERGINSGTAKIDPSFMFGRLMNSTLTQSIFLSAAIALTVWYIMRRTTAGFEMKLTGLNGRFARYAGLKSDRLIIVSMVISGAICGLVGTFEVFGLHGRFLTTVSQEFYYDGMLVAMMMRYQPLGIILMSLFFGAMKIGGLYMEFRADIPSSLVVVIQSIIIFFMSAEDGILQGLRGWMSSRRALSKPAKEG